MLDGIKQLDRILRGEATRLQELKDGQIDVSARGLAIVLLVLGTLYGLCMGLFAIVDGGADGAVRWQQLLASTLKVPLLFFLTLLVTFPSLYVFNALVGSRLTVLSALRLLVAAMGVMLAVLASLGTIIAFFSVSTTSYPFMVILNVVVFAISGVLGLAYLLQTLHRLTLSQEPRPTPPPLPREPLPADDDTDIEPADPATEPMPIIIRPPGALDRPDDRVPERHVKTVFQIWVIVFALVGAQMAWVLRPFIGNPNLPFTWFRSRGSNFFQSVWDTLMQLLRG
jgi:hypothetical protein